MVLVVAACSEVSGEAERPPAQVNATVPKTVVSTADSLVATTTTQLQRVNPRIGRPAYDDFVLLASLDIEVGQVCDGEYDSDMAACYDSYEGGTLGFESVVADNLDYYLTQPIYSPPGSGNTYTPDSGNTYTPDFGNTYSPDSPGFDVYSPGTSCSEYGNTVYCTDGTSYTQYGDTVYGSDGTSCSQYGDTVYCTP